MWQIEHQCTQCGAAVVLEEDQRLFQCPFCRVKLYISPGDFFRYYLAPAPGAGDITFVPYWRFKGMAFSFKNLNVLSSIIDVSRNATKFGFLPFSLGLRSQTRKLKFVTGSAPGSFLRQEIALEDSFAIEERFMQSGLRRSDITFIGEAMSMIYAPVYFRGLSVYDGISGESIAAMPDEAGPEFSGKSHAGEGRLSFMPSLCPECGWDLDGEPQSAVLTCGNCGSAWAAENGSFEKVPCSCVRMQGDSFSYLPFWRIEAVADGLMESRADAVRILNLPEAVRPQWESEALCALVPAFKVNPELFLKIAKVMTFNSGDFSLDEGCPKSALSAATLPLNEAFESLKIILAYSAVAKRYFAPLFPRIDLKLRNSALVYWPFIPSGVELVRPDRKFSFTSTALKWGKGI